MRDLKEPHSGFYLFKELLKSLQDYDIEYNISKYVNLIKIYINIY